MAGLRARARRLLAVDAGGGAGVAAAPRRDLAVLRRRFWPYARPYRRWLLVTLLLVAVGPVLEAAAIWLFGVLVDEVLVPGDFARFPPLAAAYVGIALAGGALAFADRVLGTFVGERFVLALRTDLFRHLQRLGGEFHERRPLGDVLARLQGDVAEIETLVVAGVADALAYALRLGLFAGLLLYLRWDLALVSLVVAPLFLLLAQRFAGRIRDVARERRRRSGALGALAEERLANVALVQAYGREDDELERFAAEGRRLYAASMAAARLRGLFAPLVDLVEIAGALVVIGFGTWQLTQGRLSLGELLVFLACLGRLYGPIRGLSRLANAFQSASAGAERVLEVLDQQPAVVDAPGASPLGRVRGEVAFWDVRYSYPGAPRPALDGVTLTLAPGEIVAVVGPSGAGKSTLAKLLLRFADPDAGMVWLDGHDLRDVRLADARRQVAVVLQEALVFDDSVRANVAYGRPEASEAEIEGALRAADAWELVCALPQGLETPIGQRGRRLSGGQRQRLAIARAMLRDAPVLLLDEPAAGLDPESARRVLAPLRRLMAGRSTLIVSHDLLWAGEADRVVVLEAGRVVEEGPPGELLLRGGRYADLHRARRPLEEAIA